MLEKKLYILPNGKFIGQIHETGLTTEELRSHYPMNGENGLVVDDSWELVFISGGYPSDFSRDGELELF